MSVLPGHKWRRAKRLASEAGVSVETLIAYGVNVADAADPRWEREVNLSHSDFIRGFDSCINGLTDTTQRLNRYDKGADGGLARRRLIVWARGVGRP